jgi:hypothetical protein
MSVGVTKDYKLKVRNLHASHTLGWSCLWRKEKEEGKTKTRTAHIPSKKGLMGDSDYSFSLTTFSPSGKLVQIEYALNAVAAGSTSLGIKGWRPSPSICGFLFQRTRNMST